jgi:hypothetical protein
MFVIIESSGDYDVYREVPLFLVKTEDEATRVTDHLNDFAKWKEERLLETQRASRQWEQENPAPPIDTKAQARKKQIDWLLRQDFKEELKALLQDELVDINDRLNEYDDWVAKKREAYVANFDSITIPDEFSDAVYDAESYASYSYVDLEVKEIPDDAS